MQENRSVEGAATSAILCTGWRATTRECASHIVDDVTGCIQPPKESYKYTEERINWYLHSYNNPHPLYSFLLSSVEGRTH